MSNSSNQTSTLSNSAEIVENKRPIKLSPLLWSSFEQRIMKTKHAVAPDDVIEQDGVVLEKKTRKPFTGVVVEYFDCGQLKFKGSFRHGKEDGLTETYHENGQLEFRFFWKKGCEDGTHEEFHENGQLSCKGKWKDGKEEGLWESFDEEGNLEESETWKSGLLVQ